MDERNREIILDALEKANFGAVLSSYDETPEVVVVPSNFRLETEPFCAGCHMGIFSLIEATKYFGDYPSTSYTATCVHMSICKFHHRGET